MFSKIGLTFFPVRGATGVVLALLVAQPFQADAQVVGQTTITIPEPASSPPTVATLIQNTTTPTNNVTLKLSFYDNFKNLDVADLGKVGKTIGKKIWQGYYRNDPTQLSNHTLTGNNEKEYYVYPSYAGSSKTALGLNPFSYAADGSLQITATRATAQQSAALSNYPYYSGMLSGINLYQQSFGYFEVSAKMATGAGMWPAFWLLAGNGAWPPEIDVLEMFNGASPNVITSTTHWKSTSNPNAMGYCNFTAANAATQYHQYGVLWNANQITYYLDRAPVCHIATPTQLQASQMMYMVLDLAVTQGVNLTTGPQSGTFTVAYVSAYTY